MNSTSSSVEYYASCHILSDVYSYLAHFPSRLAFINHVIACALNAILTITTVILNFCFVVTFLRSPRLKESKSMFLIMLLSCVDIGVGLIDNSAFVVELASDIAGTVACWFLVVRNRSSIFLTNLSLLTVTAINIERYLGVAHPFVHRTKVTIGKLLKFILLSWSTCAVMLGVSFFAVRQAIKLVFIAFTVFVYGRIAFIVINAKKRRHTTRSYTTESDSVQSSTAKRKNKLRFLAELKLAKSCFYIVICNVVCFLPASVLLGHIGKMLPLEAYYSNTLTYIWSLTLVMLNSSLNSVIFFWRSRQLRKEMKNAWKSKQRR